jgi:hypothetical protein
MNIKFDPDTLIAVVDCETYSRLTQGTEFQQSISLLVMISQIFEDTQKVELEGMNLTPEQHKLAQKKMTSFREDFLRQNPPPGIDPDALHIFCD